MTSVDKRSPRGLTISGEIEIHEVPGNVSPTNGAKERRAKPRIQVPFPAQAWGVDAAGNAFELSCVLDNISSQGVYLRLPRTVSSGDELSLVVNFVNGTDSGARALLQCQILRTEPQHDGGRGIAAEIKKYHFL